MTAAPPGSDFQVEPTAFRALYGHETLFFRYARARLRQFGVRQISTVIGVAILWVSVSGSAALAALAIAIA